jgi:DNA-binding HxlR family transcriptional regulator
MELKDLPKCPVETTLALIGEKWKILIIRDLLNGTKRFGELKKACSGISQKVLTTNLRSMEQDGLVIRKEFKQAPPRVEYTLSDVGYSLAGVLNAMASWGTDYKTFLKLLKKRG